MTAKATAPLIESYDLAPGRMLAGKYEVLSLLGKGWEGEVYKVREQYTDIERAAKFFYPHRNPGNKALRFYARKLNKLRHCPVLIQYHTQETIRFKKRNVTFLVSEYVEGELLSDYLRRQPGRRLQPFEGLHLLYSLAAGVEKIHQVNEYHGDIHTDNVIVERKGLGFAVKLLDMFHWGRRTAEHTQDDVMFLVRLLYDALGGARQYANHPDEVKRIICGLKRTLVARKFRSAGQLRRYLETMEWD